MARLWALVDRRALLVTALCIVAWRLLDQISVLDVTGRFIYNHLALYSRPGFFAAIGPNSIGISTYSIGFLGIRPYVQVLILMSIVPVFSRRLTNLIAEPRGLVTFRRWIRVIALAWAMAAAYGWTTLAWSEGALPQNIDWSARLLICLELTGGTAVMIMLADALDEFGLGFGYGALIFYALGYLADGVHRFGDYFAYSPSGNVQYLPALIWAAFTVGLVIAGVAVLLAVRRIPSPFEDERRRRRKLDIRLMMSGVLRPPQFAFVIMSLPSLFGNLYAQTHPQVVNWLIVNWGAYGATGWIDAVYLLVEAGLVVGLAVLFTDIDLRLRPAPPPTYRHITTLALLGGVFLALAAVAVPVANHYLSAAAGALIPLSGLNVLLMVAVIVAVVRAIEGHESVAPFTVSPTGLP